MPWEISQLENLQVLQLHNNPLISPPIEVVNRGIDAIKAYLKEIEREETVKLFEAKLLIVGHGRVGKTYLRDRLVYDKIDPKTVSTEGINIIQWHVSTGQTDKFRVNVWD